MFIYQVNQRKLPFLYKLAAPAELLVVTVCTLPVTNKSVWNSVWGSCGSWDFSNASAFIKTMEQKYEKNKIYKNSKIFSKLK
jgi:hypothetical protein